MDMSICNYIQILNPYVTVTYDSFIYGFFSVCNSYVLHADLVSYIHISVVCNNKFSCSSIGIITSGKITPHWLILTLKRLHNL